MPTDLNGIYAAVITPFDHNGNLAVEQFHSHLNRLARRGSHGILVAGTTGEGPSLSVSERIELFTAASKANTNLHLLAGTGAASLDDTIKLTRASFENGADAAVIIPPFFYLNAPLEGLTTYYTQVIQRATPRDGAIFLYHNPAVCGVGIDFDLIHRLRDKFPDQVVGIKDSSGDWAHTFSLCKTFPDFQVFVGHDSLLAKALLAGGAGAITGLANAFPDLLREVYDLNQQGGPLDQAQARLTATKEKFEGLPLTSAIKTLLTLGHIIENEDVRPPLGPLTEVQLRTLRERFNLHTTIPSTIDLDDLCSQ